MRGYKLKLAKMTKKMVKIRPGAVEGLNGLRPKKRVKPMIFPVFYTKEVIFCKT